MLTLDMAGLTETALAKMVAARCSEFGTGEVLRVLPPDQRRDYGIAVVQMSSMREACDLTKKFGGLPYRSRLVVINLIQQIVRQPNEPPLPDAG